ncbi:unnamed protein product [Commensalibacter communis]|uniref:DUF6973 domain-containing protein n=1 Tax=Commensalibacter communis TaxID=2972786 RepID=UPI0022FFB864|nr:hypothetical protein [Commensalibacter communis]CAI3950207.1 unnamed protein product [Commensalibacter communis]
MMPSWDKNNKMSHRQSWEGAPDKFSSGNMWNFKQEKCDKNYTNEMRLEAKKRGVYIDTHCLENDNQIDDRFVVKYTPYNNVHAREASLFIAYSIQMILIAGQTGLGIKNANDTSAIAIRFAEAGGTGIDRGGLALSFYQKFDEKWNKKEKKIGYTSETKITESWHGPIDGTQVNAARHALWNMLNIHAVGFDITGKLSALGVAATKSAVDLHEANPDALKNKKFIFDPDDYKQSSSNPNRKGCDSNKKPEECALIQADETADLLNNQIGRNLGLKYPQGTSARDLALGMLDQFYIDCLYTIQKIGGKYHVLKTRITKEQYDHMKNVYINEFDESGKKTKEHYTFPLNWNENTVI